VYSDFTELYFSFSVFGGDEMRKKTQGEGGRCSLFYFIFEPEFSKRNTLRTNCPNYQPFFSFKILASRSSNLNPILIGFEKLFSMLAILVWLYLEFVYNCT
jgi:hypothetical protein